MANIALNHRNIDEAADALSQAGTRMHSSMDNCVAALRTAEAQLSGLLATAAADFRTTLTNNEKDMTDDITKAAGALREMHGLLRDADRRAGAGIG
ncbi:hypothetical protein ACFXKJ_05565 [Kitasatospora indigofera]|uniref:Uncharacterized protein n=1 Tax=Kitasatospora indigofera TaxID=67307 RepID=A0A919G373_9ACTN|nr:hypothetical protein [Kitasatospora indigofera]GHH77210.1 hypothetical protein GCM10018781_50240 [Kitasatospora indigofera]